MCWKCKITLNFPPPISKSETCPSCDSDVRCCRNCRHYSAGSHYDCSETVDELVSDKERSNFCGWFSLNPTAGAGANIGGASSMKKAQEAKNAFDNLFGG